MADEITERFGDVVEIVFIKGGGGVFDVHLEGELLFSKHSVKRFPEIREALDLIEKALSGPREGSS
ncbi:MAG: hypothetical protein AUK47_26675 [Deltaproteobacteria bacterium CG2_30_63_29]|nr:MAG: hypothetical protein AUK47_26675 [Deltaproteobacteria bacterium CG2_30_63_29]PIW01574.1 MAG: hypothetical protein COW42_04500 [Deltaproteobacteria bacterium CG17_big_fil_post_rev_8_21_14_2_50_63_7]PJB33264.1 MAG: hypothetical protein CO108_31300 [Deltaproteobacteria bacterium CG_4_9_14_3_um_filter_63_12]